MSEFIHGFVKKMTMREKAYFKRFAQLYGRKEEKNYIKLYNVIEKMPEFEFSVLKNHFENDPIGKHLSSELNYLLSQLLRGMVNFHMDSSSTKRLQKSLLFVDVLIDKGFPKQALKTLHKAKKLAAKSEEFTILLKIIQLEEEILFKEGILDFTKMLELLSKERLRVILQINNLNKLRLIREQIRELQFTTNHSLKDQNFPAYFNDPLLDSEDGVLSAKARTHWLYIAALKSSMKKDFEKSKFYHDLAINHLEKNQHIFKRSKILPLLSNYLYILAILKDKVSFMEVLPKLEAFEKDPKLDQPYIFFVKYIRIFELFYQMSDYNASIDLEKKVEKFITTSGHLIEFSQLNYLYFSLSRSYMISNQHEMAMKCLNNWRQFGAFRFMEIHLRLFTLITFFELQLDKLLEAEIAATYKILKRQKRYNELAKALIQFFKSYIKNPKKLNAQLTVLSGKLDKYARNPANIEYAYFNYHKWVNDRIERIR